MLSARGVGAAGLIVTVALAGCSTTAAEPTVESPSSETAVAVSATSAASSPSTSAGPEPAEVHDTGWGEVGQSVRGLPILLRTLGQGPRKVLFIGGIHGDEAEGAYTTEQLPAAFIEEGLADAVTLTIIEDANPDGRAAGTRTNANGVDVNRNFPASNFDPANGGEALSQPEAQAVTHAVQRIQPDLIVVAHSWQGDEFINFDGPAEPLAARFSELTGLPVQASSSFAPTPGSLGSYFGRDLGIAVLTVEVLRGSDPVAVWERLRPALLSVIAG